MDSYTENDIKKGQAVPDVFYLLFLIYIALESFFLNLDVCKVCMQILQTWQKLRLGTEQVRSGSC